MIPVTVTFSAIPRQFVAEVCFSGTSYSVPVGNVNNISVHDQLRSLRWKAVGLHDQGDMLLVRVGAELAKQLFPLGADCGVLLSNEPKLITLNFSMGTEDLLHLPWELLYLNDRFLLDPAGSNLIRVHEARTNAVAPTASLKVLAVSLGTDPALDYQEERKILARAVERNGEIRFLLNPTLQEIENGLSTFKPSVLHVSSHGSFDDLEATHYLFTDDDRIETACLLRLSGLCNVALVVLSTCEGGKIPFDLRLPTGKHSLAPDIVGYNYPVDESTATLASETIYSALASGADVGSAVAQIRALRITDVFSFFNVTHLHAKNAALFKPVSERHTGGLPAVLPGRLLGREEILVQMAELSEQHVQVVSPAGFGARTLQGNWDWLQPKILQGQQPAPRRFSISPPLEVPRNSNLKLLLVDALDQRTAARLAREVLPAHVLAQIATHPLRIVPGFLSSVAEVGIEQAESTFLNENRLAERIAALNEPGKKLLAVMVAAGGGIAWEAQDAPVYMQMSEEDFLRARTSLLRTRSAFAVADMLIASPDAKILAKRLIPAFQSLVRDFVLFSIGIHEMLDVEKASEEQALKTIAIVHMAMFAEEWYAAHELLTHISPWFDQHGRMGELLPLFEKLEQNTSGIEKVINSGNIAYVFGQLGKFRQALAPHTQLVDWLKQHPGVHDYERNLFSASIGKVDCLLHLGMHSEALAGIQEAESVLKGWQNPLPQAEFALLGNKAELLRRLEQPEAAVEVFQHAIRKAESSGQRDVLWRFLYALAACAAEFDDHALAARAIKELERQPDLKSNDELYSKYLDVKAKILESEGDGSFVHYLFDSYEIDLARGDERGAAASLFHVVRHYALSGRSDLARERLPELKFRATQIGSGDLLARVHELENRLR